MNFYLLLNCVDGDLGKRYSFYCYSKCGIVLQGFNPHLPLLLFLEYDFKKNYKHGRSHLMAYTLNRLPNQVESIGVPN